MFKRRLRGLFCCGFASTTKRGVAGRAQVAVRWLAAIGYLILALGIPISVPGGKRTGEPYPCMNHACGCQSAEECWRHCCCFTMQERFAWARDNHVTPPDYALAEAHAQGIDWDKFCSGQPQEELAFCPCHADVCASCGEHSGCQHHDCDSDHWNDDKCSGDDVTSQSVVLIQALKCHGADQNWMGLSVSLPPPQTVRVSAAQNVVESICTASLRTSSPSFTPPTPPPRSLCA